MRPHDEIPRPAPSPGPRTGVPAAAPPDGMDSEAAAQWLAERMQRVADGDAAALAAMMQFLRPRLLRLAHGITRDRADAEEALNDAWRQVWRHAAAYDTRRAPVHGWLVAIVQRQAIDIVRRRDARARHEVRADAPIDEAITHGDPARGLEAQQGLSALRRAMLRLTTRRRMVARLALLEQRSHSEIARSTGTPLGTVKTRARDALRTLRGLLGG